MRTEKSNLRQKPSPGIQVAVTQRASSGLSSCPERQGVRATLRADPVERRGHVVTRTARVPSRALHFAHPLGPEARALRTSPAWRRCWRGCTRPGARSGRGGRCRRRTSCGIWPGACLRAVTRPRSLRRTCTSPVRVHGGSRTGLERHVLPKAAGARLEATGGEVAEVLQHLRERLRVAGEGRAPRLAGWMYPRRAYLRPERP